MLTKAVCLTFSTDDMSAYNHLVELTVTSSRKWTHQRSMWTHTFRRRAIPSHTDFNKLVSGIYRTNNLIG
jgi:hypothetical protein